MAPKRICTPGDRNIGNLEESKDKMVHDSFVLGFLKSHLALIFGKEEHKDIKQPSWNQKVLWGAKLED